MEFLYIILGILGFIMAGLLLIGGIFLLVNLQSNAEKKAIERYFKREGKQDIAQLEEYLTKHNISLPSKYLDDGMEQYANSLLLRLVAHYTAVFEDSLKEAGYQKNAKVFAFAKIYYNAKSIIVYQDIIQYCTVCKKSGEIVYEYKDAKMEEHYLTLDKVIQLCEKLGRPDAYTRLGVMIPMEDVFWYVDYPTSAGYKLTDIAAGAVVGGVLLGPVGALAGGMLSSKNRKEEEKNEVKVIFGGKSVGYWCVAKGEYLTQTVVETLSEHFPKQRYADTYQKHL